jgi:hypothetical protein
VGAKQVGSTLEAQKISAGQASQGIFAPGCRKLGCNQANAAGLKARQIVGECPAPVADFASNVVIPPS